MRKTRAPGAFRLITARDRRAYSSAAASEALYQQPPSAFPDANVAQRVINGLGYLVWLVILASLIVGAGFLAWGYISHNPYQQGRGKEILAITALAGLLLGASATIVNFYVHLGQGR